jgi:hypothetical protein
MQNDLQDIWIRKFGNISLLWWVEILTNGDPNLKKTKRAIITKDKNVSFTHVDAFHKCTRHKTKTHISTCVNLTQEFI